MRSDKFLHLEVSNIAFFTTLLFLFILITIGITSAAIMENKGHWVTGMNNQVIWGVPHVFAVSLIVASSGALNIATIGSLFGNSHYKPFGRLSGLLTLALLIGGLSILVLDLGRPDRIIIAMTHYNFKSIFAWNMFLYSGFLVVVSAYIWSMMDQNIASFKKYLGLIALIWRLALTTGTGLIFGFLIARESYDSAIMAPLFISISLAFGLAIFVLFISLLSLTTVASFDDRIWSQTKKLFYFFIASNIYFTLVQHLTGLYASEHRTTETLVLLNGGSISTCFWLGQIAIGAILPLGLLLFSSEKKLLKTSIIVSIMVIFGGFCQVYVIIIGGQLTPLVLFPGMTVSSSFFDGSIAPYEPSIVEFGLGIGGCAISAMIVYLGLRLLKFLPSTVKQ